MIDLARQFFALPPADKERVHIRHSPHFRGFSEMRNSRDWREQIHFGLEREAGPEPLRGPNLWPEALGPEWRARALAFLDEAGQPGQRLLAELGLPGTGDAEPYLLMKMICYIRMTPAGCKSSKKTELGQTSMPRSRSPSANSPRSFRAAGSAPHRTAS